MGRVHGLGCAVFDLLGGPAREQHVKSVPFPAPTASTPLPVGGSWGARMAAGRGVFSGQSPEAEPAGQLRVGRRGQTSESVVLAPRSPWLELREPPL